MSRWSPIAQRRWKNFKANRRGWYSLWFFMIIFVLSLFAEFIANDKPLMVKYDSNYYFPVFKDYPETTFGGDFDTATDYRDEYIAEIINEKGHMVWPLIRYSYDTINYGLEVPAPAPPSKENWLGTDDLARDVVARVIYGFRVSVLFGLTLTILSSIIGIAVGAVQGYVGGWVDLIGQRFLEVWAGLPMLFMLIILASVVEPTFWWLLGLMLLFSWMTLVGVVRAEVLRARNYDYVKAARSLGVNKWTILWRHVLPNAMVAALTLIPFVLNSSITTLTSLDFLGFGLPPGSASLGELLSQGKENIKAPWLVIYWFSHQ